MARGCSKKMVTGGMCGYLKRSSYYQAPACGKRQECVSNRGRLGFFKKRVSGEKKKVDVGRVKGTAKGK